MRKEKKIKESDGVKTKRFPRFGILDAVIIILVIAVAIGLAFRYNLFQTLNQLQNLKEYTVSFSVKNIEHTTPTFLNENDTVYFKNSGTDFGKITKSSDISNNVLDPSPSEHSFVEEERVITVIYPENTRIDAKGRIICKGKMSDEGAFLLNGSDYIAPGETHVVCTENVTLEINILSIDPVE